MNLTNFLLATTSLLLVVAFALSFGGFTKNINSDASTSQRDEIKAKIAQAEEEARRLELAALRRQNSIASSYIAPATTQAAPIIAPRPAESKSSKMKTWDMKARLKKFMPSAPKDAPRLTWRRSKFATRQQWGP